MLQLHSTAAFTNARRAVALLLVLGALAGSGGRLAASPEITLRETGSSLFYPLFRIWTSEYRKANAGVQIVPSGSGSGAGVAAAIAGTAQIGASDAYMSDEEVTANPQIINIPLAISAQTINYNLPELRAGGLRLSGPVLAGIYSGAITQWDAQPIADLNPGVRLPHHTIEPIHRIDRSGDTFMFSQFLSFSTPAWEAGPNYGLTVTWPAVAAALSASGNAGMVEAAREHPYSVAYVGASFSEAVAKAGLGTALLENQDGKFLLPTRQTVLAGASMLDPRTPPDERLTLVFAPGADSYPIVSYEYAVVSTKQPNEATAAALRDFLLWTIEPCSGNAERNLATVHFIPLPDYVRALSIVQIEKIT